MMRRRNLLALAMLTGPALLAPRTETLAADCSSAADAGAVGSLLLDKYAAAVNAHDTGAFPDLFAEAYIQHSGRSASGLAAQIENFRRIFSTMPDIRMQVEDRVIAGDRVAARNAYSATHTQTKRGIPPTGKSFTFRAVRLLACGEWKVRGALGPHRHGGGVGAIATRIKSRPTAPAPAA
jgi:predicted ester cyclase